MEVNMKNRVIIFVSIAAIAGLSFFLRWNYVQNLKAQRETDYRNGLEAIEKGDYEQADALLQPLNGREEYPDIAMILLYADLKSARVDGQAITKQKEILKGYDSTYEGVFSDELSLLASAVNEEYNIYKEEQDALRKEQEIEWEQEKAEREREFKQKLSKDIPYTGMGEEYIDCTIVGKHDKMKSSEDDRAKEISNKYYWYADNGKDVVLIVTCRDSKVDSAIKYYTDRYWNTDGTPHFGSMRSGGGSSGKASSSGNKYNGSYDDGYEDIYHDGDYDWDRYDEDDNYANGVDDALEDWAEYGEDW